MLDGLTPPRTKAIYCKIDDLSKTLDDNDRAIFFAAIDDHDRWGARTLSTELRRRGLSVADTTITKHRGKTCACYRD